MAHTPFFIHEIIPRLTKMGNYIDLTNYISFEINISNHENCTKYFENEKRPNIIKVLFQTDWYLDHLRCGFFQTSILVLLWSN